MPFVHLHSEHIIADLFKREKGFKTPYKKPVKIKRKSPENWEKRGKKSGQGKKGELRGINEVGTDEQAFLWFRPLRFIVYPDKLHIYSYIG